MKDENGKVIFDADEQAKVDEIVKERLARHKPEDYEDLREIASTLENFDGYAGLSASEKKSLLKQVADEQKQQRELKKLEDEDELTPAQAKKMKALEDSIETLNKTISEITGKEKAKEDAEKATKAQTEAWNKQITEFKEAHADTDLAALEADEDFIEYATGRNGTLTTLYEGYVKFTSKLEKKTADEIRAKYKSKELLSTGTGKGSKADTADYGLNERQKLLAKSGGMTYKEYSDYLKDA